MIKNLSIKAIPSSKLFCLKSPFDKSNQIQSKKINSKNVIKVNLIKTNSIKLGFLLLIYVIAEAFSKDFACFSYYNEGMRVDFIHLFS